MADPVFKGRLTLNIKTHWQNIPLPPVTYFSNPTSCKFILQVLQWKAIEIFHLSFDIELISEVTLLKQYYWWIVQRCWFFSQSPVTIMDGKVTLNEKFYGLTGYFAWQICTKIGGLGDFFEVIFLLLSALNTKPLTDRWKLWLTCPESPASVIFHWWENWNI